MKGQKVVVRGFQEKGYIGKVWDVLDGVALICSPENYEHLLLGEQALNPVGFRLENVFSLPESVELMLNTNPGYRINWLELTLWEASV
jgi:hypothetical protein